MAINNPNVIVRNNFNKEGVVFSGELVTQQTWTYTGDFQLLRIKLKVLTANSETALIVRDSSNNYASNEHTGNIRIYDEDTGLEITTITNLFVARTYNILIDSRQVNGVRLYLTPGATVEVSIAKEFKWLQPNIGDIKFTSLYKEGATGSKQFPTVLRPEHKAYAIIRCEMISASTDNITFFDASDAVYITDVNTFYVHGKHIKYNSLQLNYVGVRYFYVDISRASDYVNIYITKGLGEKIKDFSVYYTDDLSLAKRIVNAQDLIVDTIRGGVVEKRNFIGELNSYRWYVLYVDFISTGENVDNFTMSMTCKNDSGANIKPDIYFQDMSKTGITSINFKTLKFKSGYYFLDLGSIDAVSAGLITYNISGATGLNVNVTHVGQFNDISQFVKIEKEKLALENNKFKFTHSGYTIHNALDDYWVHVQSATVVNICKDDEVKQLDVTGFGWTIPNPVSEAAILLHPQFNGATRNTNLMLKVVDGGVTKWMVCNVNNVSDAFVKSNWQQVKFWEKNGTKRKIPVTNVALVDANHRFDTTLPSSHYLYDEVSANGRHIAFQGVPDLHTLRGFPECGKKLTVFGNYHTTGDRVNLWATTDGGYNIVSIFDFVGLNGSEDVNTSAFTAYSSGLTLNKVKRINPTALVKEPAEIYEITPIASGWTIAKGTSTVIEFSSAHNFNSGDLIAFTGTSTSEWNQLKTSELNGNSIGDNVYMISIVDATHITLKLYRGSYDTQLAARHIHSVNETKSGMVVATGETHPYGWTMLVYQHKKDASELQDLMTEVLPIYRLNSSEKSLQRACGVLMIEDSADPTILFNSDDSNVDTGLQFAIEGRTGLPKSSSIGLWKGKLSNIDSYENWECVMPIPEPAIWTFYYNNIIVCYYQLGGLVMSFDNGKTFTYYPYFDGARPLVGVYKGKIVMNWGYILEEK
jgi:hypothetical protein